MKHFGIGALSRATGCNIETIRNYERIGLLAEPPRTSGGHRSFSADHAKRLSFIMRARELGFSIDEIRQLLTLVEDGISCDQVQAITLHHLDAIRRRIVDLERLASVLQTASDQCTGGDAPECPVMDVLFERSGDRRISAG